MNILLIIIASLSIVIGLGIIVDYMINAKLEGFFTAVQIMFDDIINDIENELKK